MAPKRTPSSDELAYKDQEKAGFAPAAARSDQGRLSETPDLVVKGNDTSAFIGVSQEYMNYSDDTLKPMSATEGVDKAREDRYRDAVQKNVAEAPAGREDNSTQGVSTYETIATATSGSDLSADLVKAPELDKQTQAEASAPVVEESTSETPEPPKTPATPAK